ncbi:unnamed protein product, partial [Gadus morhua 'NCC']
RPAWGPRGTWRRAKTSGTRGPAGHRRHHEPAGRSAAHELDHQETVPRSLPALSATAQ